MIANIFEIIYTLRRFFNFENHLTTDKERRSLIPLAVDKIKSTKEENSNCSSRSQGRWVLASFLVVIAGDLLLFN